jgi:signal transduction histidine kinase
VDDELQRLLESRARLVACSDAARAELGRALHDGAQQRVVAVSLMLRALKGRLDDPEAVALVDQAIEELGLTGEELRDLARRLHPVALTERGLGPALFAASTRAPLPVELDLPEERFPGEIERAAYDVVIGAIECAGEAGSHLQVSLARQNGHVALDVSGCGDFDVERLCALADRVETIRGRLEIDGPVLRARFPVAAD